LVSLSLPFYHEEITMDFSVQVSNFILQPADFIYITVLSDTIPVRIEIRLSVSAEPYFADLANHL